jgi:hypothetical protein
MREHGVKNFPNPEVSGGAPRLMFRVKAGEGPTPQVMEAAQKACQRYQTPEQQNLTPQQKVQREEEALKFVRCMREHGVNLPNPTTSGGGIRIQGGLRAGVNPTSPAFEAAQKACQGLLPRFKGRPGPPAGGVGVTGKAKGGGGGGLSLNGG